MHIRHFRLTVTTARLPQYAICLCRVKSGILSFFLHFLMIGLSINGLFALIQTSATEQVAPRYIPVAFSFATLFFAIGQFLGPAIAGWLIETTGNFLAAFGFTFVVLVVGFALTLLIRRFPKEVAVG